MVAMPQKEDSQHISEEEYLEFERASEIRHEYVDGYIYAMAGASRRHNLICNYTSATLISLLGDKPCEVYQTEMRLKVQSKKRYRYPDIAVVCGEAQFLDDELEILANPTVLIEVISPSTALTDYNDKLEEYTQIESLQEYVIIEQQGAKIKRYMRQDSGKWLYSQVTGLENSIELPSIAVTLALSDVYRKVNFEDESEEET